MNELLAIVRASDRSEEERIDLGFVHLVHRIRFYRENGTYSCAVCGACEPMPRATPLFEDWPSTLTCGHAFSDLLWTPDPGIVR